MADSPRWLRAGRVGSPHGLDGSFHVTGPNAALLALGAAVMVAERERQIVRRAGTERRPILRLDGSTTRSDAEALRGSELLVARAGAPELGPEEWWAEDLEGCDVTDGEQRVGVVTRLLELPSCEVLQVERTDSAAGAQLLVPLVSDAVREVDVARRQIDIDLKFLGEA